MPGTMGGFYRSLWATAAKTWANPSPLLRAHRAGLRCRRGPGRDRARIVGVVRDALRQRHHDHLL